MKMEVTLLSSPTWRRKLWHRFYQLEGGTPRCQHKGGGYGTIATNLKEKAYVVVDASSKEQVNILNKEALALLSTSQKEETYVIIAPNLNKS